MIAELGLEPVHLSTVKRSLKRCAGGDYRDLISQACFAHVWSQHGGDVSLLKLNFASIYPVECLLRHCRRDRSRRCPGSNWHLGPSAWWANEQHPKSTRTVDPEAADYSHIFLIIEVPEVAEVRQSVVTIREVLDGLEPTDPRLHDELVQLISDNS